MNNSNGTIQGRDSFLQNVASRLGRLQPQTESPKRSAMGVPEDYAAIQYDEQQKIALFIHNWNALEGNAILVKEETARETLEEYLTQITTEFGVTKVATWEQDDLLVLGVSELLKKQDIKVFPWQEMDESVDEVTVGTGSGSVETKRNWQKRSKLLQATEQCELGIIWPDFAIANTGTLTVLASETKGRSVSLMPSILVAIFRSDQIVTRMGEVYEKIKADHLFPNNMPSSLNFISGPSRSADIEGDLTIGVHGPGKVYVIIIE